MAKSLSFVLASLLFACVAPVLIAAPQTKPLLKNGNFENWKDELPVDWKVEAGIFNGGDKPLSEIRRSKDAIEMSGNKRTLAWNIVYQTVDLKPGEVYKLSFEAKVKGLKRENNQYDNCHVGFWFKNADGKTVGNKVAVSYTHLTLPTTPYV